MRRPKLTIGEVVDLLEKAKTKKEREEVLRKNDTVALRTLLRLNFDPNIEWHPVISEGVDYKPSIAPQTMGSTHIAAEIRRLRPYLVGRGYDHTTDHRRKKNWIQLLENLDAREADILVKVSQKKLKCGLTKKLIKDVFPDLIEW